MTEKLLIYQTEVAKTPYPYITSEKDFTIQLEYLYLRPASRR